MSFSFGPEKIPETDAALPPLPVLTEASVREFIGRVEMLCQKYNISVGHEDVHGLFQVEVKHPAHLMWMSGAECCDGVSEELKTKFVNELFELYAETGLALSHEDCEGNFKLHPYCEYNSKWLEEAVMSDR